MTYPCRGNDCHKSFSTSYNRNKHEKAKGHWSENKKTSIEFNEETSLFICPTAGCSTTSKYKSNIVKHLKSCYAVNRQRNSVAQKKICTVCGKEFAKKSNRDRHFKQFHSENDNDNATEAIVVDELPTMATIFSPDEQITEVPLDDAVNELSFENETHDEITIEGDDENFPSVNDAARETLDTPTETPNDENTAKRARLEIVIGKITRNIDHSFTFNQCVIDKLRNDLQNNKTVAVQYMRSCFDTMLDDEDFFNWLSSAVGFKE